MGSFTTIDTLDHDGTFTAYVAEPEGAPKAAIIVIQEIFGVNEGIRRKCDSWAAKGYLAIAPDLFWRAEPSVELDADVQEDFQRGVGLMMKLDQALAIRDIEATIKSARIKLGGDGHGKVGAVGYCLGGRLTYMTATRTDINASVGYYGVGLEGLLEELHAIAHPLMLHIAEEDGFVSKEAQAQVHAGLDSHTKVTIHDYPDLDHGFAAETGLRRNEEGAKLADSRTEAFFAKHLG